MESDSYSISIKSSNKLNSKNKQKPFRSLENDEKKRFFAIIIDIKRILINPSL